METTKKKLKKEIANIWDEVKFDILLPLFIFAVVSIIWFIYIEFFSDEEYEIMDLITQSLMMGVFFAMGMIITGLIFQFMSAISNTTITYRGGLMSKPDDLENNIPRIKLYGQLIAKIIKYLKS